MKKVLLNNTRLKDFIVDKDNKTLIIKHKFISQFNETYNINGEYTISKEMSFTADGKVFNIEDITVEKDIVKIAYAEILPVKKYSTESTTITMFVDPFWIETSTARLNELVELHRNISLVNSIHDELEMPSPVAETPLTQQEDVNNIELA